MNFVQPVVNACLQGDKKPNTSVAAETMKLLANSSYGYLIVYHSRAIQLQGIQMMKIHMQRSTKKVEEIGAYQQSIFWGRISQIWNRM